MNEFSGVKRSSGWLLLAFLAGCGGGTPDEGPDLGVGLQAALDSLLLDNPGIPGAALYVEHPGRGLRWSGAAGAVGRETDQPLTPDHPVRIASITKTYTAAAILRLFEDGRFGLDDLLADHLPKSYVDLLASDAYPMDQITIRQVLSHTSGIYDYAFGPGSNFGELALGDLQHRWTRREQVELAVTMGDPVGPPNAQYHYSDTGFVLLGEIIEQKTGLSLAAAFRELLGFDRLGLSSTYLESLEPVPVGATDRAHQYTGDLDAYAADPSFDLYGGGGLVATVGDMAAFFKALVGGQVFSKPETLQAMLTVPDVPETVYALGIARVELGSETCWGHGGFWGTSAVSCPVSGLTIARTINQNEGTGPAAQALMDRVMRQLGTTEN